MHNFGLITTAQAAGILQMPHRSVLRLVKRGQLTPAAKLHGYKGAYLFERDQVTALARSREERAA